MHAQVWTNKFSEPRIISGADIGIRVEGERNGVLVGPLVVRVDGKWIEVQVRNLLKSGSFGIRVLATRNATH